MAILYGPFDSGAGAAVYENFWSLMAREWKKTGVIRGRRSNLSVTAPGTGLQVIVAPGTAWIEGHFFDSDASTTVAVASNSTGSTRQDYVCITVNWSTNSIGFEYVTGSTSLPTLTQTLGVKYQFPLYQVSVPNGATSVSSGQLTDVRAYTFEPPKIAQSTADVTITATTAATAQNVTGASVTITAPGDYDLTGTFRFQQNAVAGTDYSFGLMNANGTVLTMQQAWKSGIGTGSNAEITVQMTWSYTKTSLTPEVMKIQVYRSGTTGTMLCGFNESGIAAKWRGY